MNQVKTFFTTLNKWQTIVLLVTVVAVAWLLLNAYIIKSPCLYSMCPINDPSLWPRIGFLVACSAVAMWLLKTPKPKVDQN